MYVVGAVCTIDFFVSLNRQSSRNITLGGKLQTFWGLHVRLFRVPTCFYLTSTDEGAKIEIFGKNDVFQTAKVCRCAAVLPQ